MQLRRCSDVYFTLVLTRSPASELLKNKFSCASTKPALPVCSTRTPTRGCRGRISQKSKTDDWWGLSMITSPASPRARTCLDVSTKLSLDSHMPTGSWSMKNPCEFRFSRTSFLAAASLAFSPGKQTWLCVQNPPPLPSPSHDKMPDLAKTQKTTNKSGSTVNTPQRWQRTKQGKRTNPIRSFSLLRPYLGC